MGTISHGHTLTNGVRHFTPTYRSWADMKSRCTNPNRGRDTANYLDRGITYDPRWERFDCFLEDMGARPEGMTLDRRDNSLGYSKSNCRWATASQQARNTRSTKLTVDRAVEVICRYARGDATGDIAKDFNISRRLITWVVQGERPWPEAMPIALRILGIENVADIRSMRNGA